jgi:hypothetical protein
MRNMDAPSMSTNTFMLGSIHGHSRHTIRYSDYQSTNGAHIRAYHSLYRTLDMSWVGHILILFAPHM